MYQYITKIRGWDVFSIVFKKIENFSLNVFINIVFIKKMSVALIVKKPTYKKCSYTYEQDSSFYKNWLR